MTDAFTGTGTFEGSSQQGNIRLVGVMLPIRVGMFVRDDSDIESVADLKGKRLAWGYTSQHIIQTVLNGVLANAGLGPDDLEQVYWPGPVHILSTTPGSWLCLGDAVPVAMAVIGVVPSRCARRQATQGGKAVRADRWQPLASSIQHDRVVYSGMADWRTSMRAAARRPTRASTDSAGTDDRRAVETRPPRRRETKCR